MATRIERDSMGELQVPAEALWGAQTQRAVQNFAFSGLRMPRQFLRALGLIKYAAAAANVELGLLPRPIAEAIQQAAIAVANGGFDREFPVDVFQTGSGTSSNMNANEVIANLAARQGVSVHPNDHVNMSQSSNDVIPAAIHLSAALAIHEQLIPALIHLVGTIDRKSREHADVVVTGRTHLMDAMPLTLGQALSAWGHQIQDGLDRLRSSQARLLELALGGTAVGTGINAHPEFARRAIAHLSEQTELALAPATNPFALLSSQDTAVEISGQLKVLAVSLLKIANDLRWMNSGPLAGLGEISLRALQPGSSIMPGKVNPVIPEAVAMIAARVIGNDACITIAGQSGNFQLNVMLPLVAHDLLQSIDLLANGSRSLADLAICDFIVNTGRIAENLSRNPILVTALNPLIGYERAAQIAKRAYAEGRPILEVAAEMTELDRHTLEKLLDARALASGGIVPGAQLG